MASPASVPQAETTPPPAPPPVMPPAVPSDPAQNEILEDLLGALDKADWDKLSAERQQLSDPLSQKLLDWLVFTDDRSTPNFAQVDDFIRENPSWPWPITLQRKAEELLPEDWSPTQVIAWFESRQPRSIAGISRLAAALLAEDPHSAPARELLRQSWRTENFSAVEEKAFLAAYGPHLSVEDHQIRADNLVWRQSVRAARRMLTRLPTKFRAVINARLALMRRSKGVDAAIAKVPEQFRDDPGLVYERLRWRRRKGRDADAWALLAEAPDQSAAPEKWWVERKILARRALANNKPERAYRLAAEHDLSDGASFAAAEWLAGWIALRFLERPGDALGHFERLAAAVSYPISRARATYWSGRAAEALAQPDLARQHFTEAAQYGTTYYGQLARTHLSSPPPVALLHETPSDPQEMAEFARHELVAAIRVLARHHQQRAVRSFLRTLYGQHDSATWRALTAQLAAELERPDLGLLVAKLAVRDGDHLDTAYPQLALPTKTPEPGLVLAVIRQESAFDTDAISPAGARGLMQLMPSTANVLARRLKVGYTKSRLTDNPDYNLRLGSYYLNQLIKRFEGSYVLALASYNAGPARVKSWIKALGDPRAAGTDIIDWVERIPLSETRNYVQRVLENLQVYRHVLGQRPLEANTLLVDLKRSGVSAKDSQPKE